MNNHLTRRSFLRTSTAMAAAAGPLLAARTAGAGEFTGKIKKAVKYGMIQEDLAAEDKLRLVKDLGYAGVEPGASQRTQGFDPKTLARAAEKVGVSVHGVVNSSHPNLHAAIDEAKMYGASSVLTTIPRMPKNGSYLDNYRRSQQIIRDAAERAQKQGIYILIENVWASFLIEPLTMARYVDELDHPFVKVYFDVGNVVRWGWPQNWIEVLGKRIVKLDIKEYDLDVAMNDGMRKAFDVPLGEGSVEWDKVRRELAKLHFTGWATAEVRGGDRRRLADISAQMDRVLDL